MPDLPSILRWLREQDDPEHHRHVMHFMFGTQAYNGDFHLSGYTELLLCDELFRAGFGDVEMELRDGWLWEVGARPPGGSPLGHRVGRRLLPARARRRGRWAGQSAELCLCLGGDAPEEVALELLALATSGRRRRRLQITGDGVEQRIELTEEPRRAPRCGSRARPGATRLTLTTEGRPAEDGRDARLPRLG